MANFRLYSTNLVPVWNEGTQQYDYVPEKAWVAANHVIIEPWYQVWYYETPSQVWDNGSQQYVPLNDWLPYKPNTQPPGYTLLAQPSGNTTKKNTQAEVLLMIDHFVKTLGAQIEALNTASEQLSGTESSVAVVSQGEIAGLVADGIANHSLAFSLATDAASVAARGASFAQAVAAGVATTINAQGIADSSTLAITLAALQAADNQNTIALAISLVGECLSIAQSQLAALQSVQAPPDVIAQAQVHVDAIAALFGQAQANLGLALFGYGGMYSGGLNNNGAPGIFSGGDDPDDGGAAVSATGDANGSLDAP